MQISLFLLAAAFVFGSIIGSFLNVVILRLPDPAASIAFPPSHCPKCKNPLHLSVSIHCSTELLDRIKHSADEHRLNYIE